MKRGTQHLCESIYCTKQGLLRCADCPEQDIGAAYYCSPQHQKEGWSLHKTICKHAQRNVVVDGYRLCDAIWKANDAVQISLTNKHFGRIQRVGERDLVIHTVQEDDQYGDAVNNREETVEEVFDEELKVKENDNSGDGKTPRKRYRIVDMASEYGNLGNYDSVCAYWAYRSMCSTFTLNTTLYYLLRAYQNKGYTKIVFQNTEIPLENLEMAMIQVEPMLRVHHNEMPQKIAITTTLTLVSVGGYGIDVSAGRFWIFGKNQRPLIVMKKELFGATVGKFRYEYTQEAVERHLKNMFKNQDTVLDGASVFKRAMDHLGLAITDPGQCPEHFKDIEPRDQRQKLEAICTVIDNEFADVIEKYVQSGQSPLVHMANAAYHCIDDIKAGVLEIPTTTTTTKHPIAISTSNQIDDTDNTSTDIGGDPLTLDDSLTKEAL